MNRLDPAIRMNDIDGAVGIAEPDGSVPLPFTFQHVISEAGHCAGSAQPFDADEVDPESKLSNNVRRDLVQLLPGRSRQLDLHCDSVP